jgi:hypothetical protein
VCSGIITMFVSVSLLPYIFVNSFAILHTYVFNLFIEIEDITNNNIFFFYYFNTINRRHKYRCRFFFSFWSIYWIIRENKFEGYSIVMDCVVVLYVVCLATILTCMKLNIITGIVYVYIYNIRKSDIQN